ncbi:hypothetical protein [Rufibacter roseus]|uniref:STAS/SEC14 domain-containing protein n=2 Tax=Rufibacter roseus TaxID=1567108 RepID=A0ABW2DSD0_9BACT|nr:hypothetical protein [Rufibacter roseus]
MMLFPVETDFYKVSLDDADKMVILYWKRKVNFPEYKDGFKMYLHFLKQSKVKRSILDSTLRGDLDAESDEWVLATLNNEIAHLDIKDHQIALVMSEEKYQQQINSYSLLQAGHIVLPVGINYFTNMEEAKHWLLHEDMSLS